MKLVYLMIFRAVVGLYSKRYLTVTNALNESSVERYPIKGMDRLLGPQELEARRISLQPAHEGDNVVSPTH